MGSFISPTTRVPVAQHADDIAEWKRNSIANMIDEQEHAMILGQAEKGRFVILEDLFFDCGPDVAEKSVLYAAYSDIIEAHFKIDEPLECWCGMDYFYQKYQQAIKLLVVPAVQQAKSDVAPK